MDKHSLCCVKDYKVKILPRYAEIAVFPWPLCIFYLKIHLKLSAKSSVCSFVQRAFVDLDRFIIIPGVWKKTKAQNTSLSQYIWLEILSFKKLIQWRQKRTFAKRSRKQRPIEIYSVMFKFVCALFLQRLNLRVEVLLPQLYRFSLGDELFCVFILPAANQSKCQYWSIYIKFVPPVNYIHFWHNMRIPIFLLYRQRLYIWSKLFHTSNIPNF